MNRPLPLPLTLIATAAFSAAPAPSRADVFYSNNFETAAPWPEWSNVRTTQNTAFTRFLGRYANDAATLTVPTPPDYHGPRDNAPDDPPPPPPPDGDGPQRTILRLDFWLYIIDSWDGSESTYGPDHFSVSINGAVVFNETFANQHAYQSYPRDPDAGRAQMGFDLRWLDSIYFISIPFDTTGPDISITFSGYGLQGLSDESWGIDNVSLSTVVVPAPAVAAPLALALGVIARRRRT